MGALLVVALATGCGPAKPTWSGRRPGLWRLTMTSEALALNGGVATTTQCVDPTPKGATDLPVNLPPGCFGPLTFSGPPPSWTFNKTCPSPSGETVTISGTAAGDFKDRYSVQMTLTTSGATDPARNGVVRQSLQAQWIDKICH